MTTTYLLLGSNLGDRQMFLSEATKHIATGIGHIVQKSSIYETEAWGNTSTPEYLNQVLKVETLLQPLDLLTQVSEIEKKLGRKREEKWGARYIDIDILFYDEKVIDMADLKVPHPFLHERRFTLEPLSEINPDFIHPVLNQSISELKRKLADNLIVKKL